MKKYLYFLSIAAAALVSCTKEKTEDTVANLTYFEKGVRIVASAEQSKVSVDLVGEPGSLLSQMNWQVGDHITLFHNGKTYDFMTSSSGPVATFYPVNESDVIYYISEDEPIAAYYNVTSVAADGKATFSIPAEQTEKELSNKVPLYTYASTADIYDDCLELIFKPLASVLEFKVSASLAPISATLPSSDDFSYELTKVVLTPKDGASGYTVFNSATIDPATGTITPSGASLSPLTLNFPTPANIAVEEGRHFQMIVGKCEMNNTGAVMDWYKGDILNYTKTIWASQDVDLATEPAHVYQPIKDKVVGLSSYSDYYSKFFANRTKQEQFINICDDERKIILGGDIIMTGAGGNRTCCFQNLSWNFDGKGHFLYDFDVTDEASGQNRIYGFFSGVQADIKNVNFGGKNRTASITLSDASDARGSRVYAPITDLISGTIENVTSYIDYTLAINKTDKEYYIGGIVGMVQPGNDVSIIGCKNMGSITVTQGSTAQKTYVGGIFGYSPNLSLTVADSENHADLIITKDGSGQLLAGGIAGMTKGLSIIDCQNLAEIIDVEVNTTGDLFVAGIVGNGSADNKQTFKGVKNYTLLSIKKTNSGNAYSAGIIGHVWGAATLEGCENYGDVSFENSYTEEHETQFKMGGILGRIGSSQGATIKDCLNAGSITSDVAKTPKRISLYNVGGLAGDFQQGSTMINCTHRGSVVSAKENGAYVDQRGCWLAPWAVKDWITSASVLKGVEVNGVIVDESNYNKKNIWAAATAPDAGVLTLITE